MCLLGVLFFNPVSASSQSQKLKSRDQIEKQYQWRTEDVFKTDEEWEDSFNQLKEMQSELAPFKGRLAESSDMLLNCLKIRDKINILMGKLSFYAHLKNDEDTRVSKYQAFRERISTLGTRVRQAESFIQPEIIAMPESKIWQFVDSNEDLKVYRHYLEDLLRSKKHILNQEGEQLLALSGDMAGTPYQVFSMFNNADIKFPAIKDENGKEVELTKGNFSVFMRSGDRRVREDAFRAMYTTYNGWINTLAASLSGAVKRDIFNAKARKYNSALEAALDADNIPAAVYDNVISTLNNNLEPMHKYMALRKKILGVDRVHPWDLYVPLLNDLKWEISYTDAVDTIKKALAPLGNEYLKIMNEGFSSGWLDVYENQGKRSGAYSSAVYGVSHPFMLLNYNNMLDDMFTVAHEMGHSMHSYFTLHNQPFIYSDYTIFVAEVASTLNEAILMDYMLKHTTDRRKKLYLLNQYIDQIRGTVYIQAIFAEFEKRIHDRAEAGEALTAETFNSIARDIYTRYYGPDFEMDSLYDVNWSRIPHFYYNFYVYQYATGLSASTALAQKILAGDKQARDAYLRFLTRGSSDYSINLLKDAGVDMTSPAPIEATARLFSSLLDEMEKLMQQ
ncbi:MAG: oligoendopeptidase F [Calditrichia bacterium]